MRILVVGAGAIGGYFGGRLLEAGRDVTFLVRPARAARLAETGLSIRSAFGDFNRPSPPTITADAIRRPFEVVLVGCKSYDLDGAIADFAPAVGAETAVVPLLNGMRHLDVLDARFGADRILGGLCLISTKLDDAGRIAHLSDVHRLAFGARSPVQAKRVEAIADAFAGATFESRACDDVILEMWEKWVFLASLAGITCLMRASIGDVAAVGGADLADALLEECRAVAEANGRFPRPTAVEAARARLTAPGSHLAASMLIDLERGGPTEADHVLGDLLHRRPAPPSPDRSLLRIAYTALKAQEVRVARESGLVPPPNR
jgi:2-dehydropantoate 2-reductase